MRFRCRYENRETGEQRVQLCTLDPNEIEAVERVRATEGDDVANVHALAYVLRSGYSELGGPQWIHMAPPERLMLN